MASIVRRNGKWRAQILRAGIRESKTFETRQEAADWAAERESALLSGAGVRSRQTLVQAVGRWRVGRDITRSDETRLRALLALPWASKPLAELTRQTISDWRDVRLAKQLPSGRTVAPATVAREMATLRSVLVFARDNLGWIGESPMRRVTTPKEPPSRRRVITHDEREGVLAALGWSGEVTSVRHEVAVAMLLALETAMRAGELLGLRWANISDNVAHLPKTKNGDARNVPLSTAAVDLLERMRAKRLAHIRTMIDADRVFHIDGGTLDTLFRRARFDAGYDGFTFHDTRATALTRLAKLLTPLELARMVGHRDLNSLLLYYAEPASAIAAKLG